MCVCVSEGVTALMGRHNPALVAYRSDEEGEERRCSTVIVHEDWNPRTKANVRDGVPVCMRDWACFCRCSGWLCGRGRQLFM